MFRGKIKGEDGATETYGPFLLRTCLFGRKPRSGSTHLPQHGIILSIRDLRFDVPAEKGGNLRRFQHRRGTGTTQSGRVPNPTKVCRMSRTKFSLLNCLLEVLAHEVNATMT